MAQYYNSGNSPLSHPRHRSHILLAVGFVVLLAIASGTAFSLYDSNREKASSAPQKQGTQPAGRLQDTLSDNATVAPALPHAAAADNPTLPADATPQAVNNSSTTTVTVNGQTSTVHGNGAVNRSYTSEDGRSKVHISVTNTVNGVKEELRKQ